jgi:predicted DNA-binding transcriptional regulator YafY
MTRLDRALGIVLALRSGKEMTARQLAQRFQVSLRTIHRDIETLSVLGVPVYTERGRRGGFRLLEGYFLPPIMFTQDEALGLVAGLTLLQAMRSHPFAAALDTAEKKLVAAVPDHLGTVLQEARLRIGFEMPESDIFHPEPVPVGTAELPSAGMVEDQAVQTFLEGVFNRKAVELHYRSPYRSEATHQIIEPLGILWDRGYWYLSGRTAGDQADVRLWRADRVIAIRLQTQTVPIEPSFDIRLYLERKWLGVAMQHWTEETPVKIRLTHQQAERLRRDWYYCQGEFESLSDQETLLTIGADDPEVVLELLRWLGPGAELLEPAAWRELMREQLAYLLTRYSEGEESHG